MQNGTQIRNIHTDRVGADVEVWFLPVTLEKLQETLQAGAARDAELHVSLRADKEAPFGKIVNVMDAAKAAGVKHVNAQTLNPGTR